MTLLEEQTLWKTTETKPAEGEDPLFGLKTGLGLADQPWDYRLSREDYFSHLERLPVQTLSLGLCEDGLPVLLDLQDPRPGALLILGAAQSGKTGFLQLMLQTLILNNSAYEASYAVIYSREEEWRSYCDRGWQRGYCIEAVASYESGVVELVHKMASLAEQRYSGRHLGPPVLLVIDDLHLLLQVDLEVRLNLEWLCKNGPAMGVWPVASLPASQAQAFSHWVELFTTRVFGHMSRLEAGRLGAPRLDAERLLSGRQFSVQIQNEWTPFWLPALA